MIGVQVVQYYDDWARQPKECRRAEGAMPDGLLYRVLPFGESSDEMPMIKLSLVQGTYWGSKISFWQKLFLYKNLYFCTTITKFYNHVRHCSKSKKDHRR
jgi:hypothetical protein